VSEVADRAGLATRFDLVPSQRLEATTAREVQRIVREATTNVVRHAEASILTVSLRRRDGRVRIVLTDDGVGFDPAAPSRGFGRRSMTERAAVVGGRLTIEPRSNGGTRVVLEVPVGDDGVEPEVRGDDAHQAGSIA
jgi:signal transduction histidine kinase